MVDAAAVRQRVLDTLQRIAPDLSIAELNPTAPLRDQVDLDSLDWLNFAVALRDRFGVDVAEADFAKLAALDDVVGYLCWAHAASAAPRVSAARSRGLLDGNDVTIRPIKPEDAESMRKFLDATSDESRYRRFHKWIRAPSDKLVHFLTDVDQARGVALVASLPKESGEEIIGEARCLANPDGRSCDMGLLVEDAWQKTGVAGLLMEALIEASRGKGFATIEGLVLASNVVMLRFVRALGFEIEPVAGDGTVLRIRRRLQPNEAALPID